MIAAGIPADINRGVLDLFDAWMGYRDMHASLLGLDSWNANIASFDGLLCALAVLLILLSKTMVKGRNFKALWILSVIALSCHLPSASAFHDRRIGMQQRPLLKPSKMPAALQQESHPLLRLTGGGDSAAPVTPPKRITLGKRNWWSLITFSYINDLIKAGYDHPLEEEELPELPLEDSAVLHGRRLEESWLQLKQEANNYTSPNATISAVLLPLILSAPIAPGSPPRPPPLPYCRQYSAAPAAPPLRTAVRGRPPSSAGH